MSCHRIIFIYVKLKKKIKQAPNPVATDPVHIICMSEEEHVSPMLWHISRTGQLGGHLLPGAGLGTNISTVGFSEVQKPQVFDWFQQTDNNTTFPLHSYMYMYFYFD